MPSPSTQKKDSRKRGPWQVLAVEPGAPASSDKKTKTGDVATTEPPAGPWCTYHESPQHDAKDCKTIQDIVGRTRKCHTGGCYNCGEAGHISRECPAKGIDGVARQPPAAMATSSAETAPSHDGTPRTAPRRNVPRRRRW